MARSLIIFTIVALMIPTISLAVDYTVGDDDGWTIGINYEDWAIGKQFFIGDTLVFKYDAGDHNVYKVDGDAFRSCTVPSNSSMGSFTGDDEIKLTTAGNKWFICGVAGHCGLGQKLKVTVLDNATPAPAPAPAPYFDSTL